VKQFGNPQSTIYYCCHKEAKKIIKDLSHPNHCLFTLHNLEGGDSTGASKQGERD
jgi:hypothetical protein